MPEAARVFSLNGQTSRVRLASDGDVERWLEGAKRGDEEAREKLFCWAYFTAHAYYQAKVGVERRLTPRDAEELTSEFFLEFEQTLPRMQTATRFARRVMRQKLGRFIRRERLHRVHGTRSQVLDEFGVPHGANRQSERPWERWNDTQWYQYRATLQVLREADRTTRSIVEARARGDRYDDVARDVHLSEAAVRMRVTRFYKAVRSRYQTLERKSETYRRAKAERSSR